MRVGSAHSSRGPLGGGAVLGLPRCAVPRLRKLHSGLCWRGLWPCGPWRGVWGGVGGCGGGGRGRGFDTTFACFLAAAAGVWFVWGGGGAGHCGVSQICGFPNISSFSKILSLKLFATREATYRPSLL